MTNQEGEVIVGSLNDAKQSIREIQEKLFDEEINSKEIFNITVKINDYLDEIATKLYKEKK
tara:strand:- start:453 stop:635 length:183 start_codon:yes stop_codon:yes gene_type:complete